MYLGGGDPNLERSFRARGVQGLEEIAQAVGLDLSGLDAGGCEVVVAFVASAFGRGEGVAWAARRIELAIHLDYAEAFLVAHTVMMWTLNDRNLARYGAGPYRVREIDWLAHFDACDLCRNNADAGHVALRAPFPSGHSMPPAHPGCRCSTASVVESP